MKEAQVKTSVPFMQRRDGEIRLNYDTLRVMMGPRECRVTFLQGSTEVYEHLAECKPGDQIILHVSDCEGSVKLKLV